jgi:hypothetical protein
MFLEPINEICTEISHIFPSIIFNQPLPNGLALSCLPQRDSSVLPGGRLRENYVCVLALLFTNAISVSLSAWLGEHIFLTYSPTDLKRTAPNSTCR